MRRLIVAQVARLKVVVPRIGKATAGVIAACFLARMPELGRLSSRQVTALAGLAPFDRQSGKISRPGRCSGGKPTVRRCLYLAALSIAHSGKGNLATTNTRLRDAGKPAKVASSPPCESS